MLARCSSRSGTSSNNGWSRASDSAGAGQSARPFLVCRACSTAWRCNSSTQPDGGEELAKRTGKSPCSLLETSERGLQPARFKTSNSSNHRQTTASRFAPLNHRVGLDLRHDRGCGGGEGRSFKAHGLKPVLSAPESAHEGPFRKDVGLARVPQAKSQGSSQKDRSQNPGVSRRLHSPFSLRIRNYLRTQAGRTRLIGRR